MVDIIKGQTPSPYLEASPRCPATRGIDEGKDAVGYRLVGARKLRELLQPRHKYFEWAQGYLEGFSVYEDSSRRLCYPRVKIPSGSRLNPYRKTQLRSKHSATSIKKLLALKDRRGMEDFKVAVVILTYPRKISEWLSGQKGDVGMAWRMFNRFWSEDFSQLESDSSGQGAYVNLHKWKTEEPVSPHYHFHCLIPNYRLVEGAGPEDEDGEKSSAFQKKAWSGPGDLAVPFRPEVLDALKKAWYKRLYAFAARHKLTRFLPDSWQGINVWVEYVSWNDEIGRMKLMNKLNYQSRHWVEDYAAYSNVWQGCADPPPWLASYNNNARVFGWWRHLKSLTEGVCMEEKEKLSPFTGAPMTYKGLMTFDGLMKVSDGQVGTLEFEKGKPILGMMTVDDLAWLRSVMLQL